MASNIIGMASNLIAMGSNSLGFQSRPLCLRFDLAVGPSHPMPSYQAGTRAGDPTGAELSRSGERAELQKGVHHTHCWRMPQKTLRCDQKAVQCPAFDVLTVLPLPFFLHHRAGTHTAQ